MVLRTAGPRLHGSSQPGETCRTPELKHGNRQAFRFAVEFAELLTFLALHDGTHVVEDDLVPFVADLAHSHQWARDRGNLEDALHVAPDGVVAQIELLLRFLMGPPSPI